MKGDCFIKVLSFILRFYSIFLGYSFFMIWYSAAYLLKGLYLPNKIYTFVFVPNLAFLVHGFIHGDPPFPPSS